MEARAGSQGGVALTPGASGHTPTLWEIPGTLSFWDVTLPTPCPQSFSPAHACSAGLAEFSWPSKKRWEGGRYGVLRQNMVQRP